MKNHVMVEIAHSPIHPSIINGLSRLLFKQVFVNSMGHGLEHWAARRHVLSLLKFPVQPPAPLRMSFVRRSVLICSSPEREQLKEESWPPWCRILEWSDEDRYFGNLKKARLQAARNQWLCSVREVKHVFEKQAEDMSIKHGNLPQIHS